MHDLEFTDKKNRIEELTALLNEASRAYYAEDREIMSNLEYDRLYDELKALEEETGIVLSSSPTLNVGYEAVDALPKEDHLSPMLSLDKTKDTEELKSFVGRQKTLLSWKLDGLTVVLTYREGSLFKAVTRGNGITGEVVTNNARVFKNLPLKIPYQGELVLRGEAVITYRDFEKINASIEDADAKYKNPRNLCSGSVRQLDNSVTAERNVRFFAFGLVSAPGVDFEDSHENELLWLKSQGFAAVEYKVVTDENLDSAIAYFAEAVQENDLPSDGLVALYDSISYGISLGRTAKFPRNAYAFKWADEQRETHLLEVEWSPSRTGLINPVAVFEPVELEGTTVSRASVHNVSIVKELKLGIGDSLLVYKANMIIPQIAENLTKSGTLPIPDTCPACLGKTEIRQDNEAEVLFCPNRSCPAKKLKSFALFCSRDAMNIDGLSEATLEKLIGRGLIHSYADLYDLSSHKEEIKEMEGFGEKSCERLFESIRTSADTTLPRLLYGLGIPNIGVANAKVICRHFDDDLQQIREADLEELSSIDTIGPVIGKSVYDHFRSEEKARELDALLPHLRIRKEERTEEQILAGKIFVVTGSLVHYENRSALKEQIEALGGKVTGSVSARTDYLINNDTASNSSKNKKARELQIPVLSEEDFIDLINRRN